MLSWGVPTIRFGNNDFSINSSKHNGEVTSNPISGTPTAILYINEINGSTINAKLVEVSTSRVVFDQAWVKEKLHENTNFYFCPDYHSFPNSNEQPRLLLMKALGINAIEPKAQPVISVAPTKATIIKHGEGGTTWKMKLDEWKETHSGQLPYHEQVNVNCPVDIGWENSDYGQQGGVGRPFVVKGKAYYIRPQSGHHYAFCNTDSVYIYKGFVNYGKYLLNIEKRTLPNFEENWREIFTIPYENSHARDDVLQIRSIQETNDGIAIELVNTDSGEILTIQTLKLKGSN